MFLITFADFVVTIKLQYTYNLHIYYLYYHDDHIALSGHMSCHVMCAILIFLSSSSSSSSSSLETYMHRQRHRVILNILKM
ncbi:hypothetical protein DERF_004472 [Dermatophagoides farinae]|uniref:Uncharacterized protein n=1 Tax=Dermatophagoides farinae TaxID=6954 RepID=A0A922L7R6_DERFA|nr:hypothetical protein DERF_004472 [Dermatophagoides farinae]